VFPELADPGFRGGGGQLYREGADEVEGREIAEDERAGVGEAVTDEEFSEWTGDGEGS
jgi:hypothetical protein